jgi:protein phosphatase
MGRAFRLDIADGQIVGERERQEDACAWRAGQRSDRAVLVLADGMGGAVGGAEAAGCVCCAAMTALLDESSEPSKAAPAIAIEAATAALAALKAAGRPELQEAGSTLVAVRIEPRGLMWASVGDSPLLLMRSGELLRLNQDHSATKVLAAIGEGEGRSALLLSNMSGESPSMIDHRPKPVPLARGDRILLASDGVWALTDEGLKDALAAETAEACVQRLLDAPTTAETVRRDNFTVIVADVVEGPAIGFRQMLEKPREAT